MIGAIVGDIVGSPYEFDNIKRWDFRLFGMYHGKRARPTDDSVMTLAIAQDVPQQDAESQDFAEIRMGHRADI